MNRGFIALLLIFFPLLVFADSSDSLTFAPPASDYSMVFLGNIFGVVDGVLHGTSSQIMGTMFSVFNSAVLALGGMVIMYTLMVSTMNTAHEGQMLGQKWSSIWIPVRSTLGLALLMPKASGYCMMQIFVMWVVTQGIGAADKVWEAALSYLNRGGVLIKAQATPSLIPPGGAQIIPLEHGAITILVGQVCMLSIQRQLENYRNEYLQQKGNGAGPCYKQVGSSSYTDPFMQGLCETPVPDFLSSVNFVAVQNNDSTAPSYTVPMPNLAGKGTSSPNFTNPYAFLDGVCGTVYWNQLDSLASYTAQTGSTTTLANSITLSASELQTSQMSRAIALQQMYTDFLGVTQVMVGNDPFFNTNPNPATNNFSAVANQQFGVPYTASGVICPSASSSVNQCTTWGPAAVASATNKNMVFGVLFNGTEFLGAMNDYNSVMYPVLNLKREMQEGQTTANARAFITNAVARGWMMAGSYFFDLVALNGSSTTNTSLQDSHSGLEKSTPLSIKEVQYNSLCGSSSPRIALCHWLAKGDINLKAAEAALIQMESLFDGFGLGKAIPAPLGSESSVITATSGYQSSTVYGFINNSRMLALPVQPGVAALKFANAINFTPTYKPFYLTSVSFPCGSVYTFFWSFCLGQLLGDVFYNLIFMNVYNALVEAFQQTIQTLLMDFIEVPIMGMSQIFDNGLKIIDQPGVNPIIALANMGVTYINFSGNLWMNLLGMAVTSALIPVLGLFIFALLTFALPLVMSWIGIMCGVGFTTAYYVPVLPYMIFIFGVIAWLMAVIEAMVAAPIVALGVTHPEGHDAFGKGEAAIMLLMNVFLRPALMIIGYVAAIPLCYAGVWILNAGFDHAISFIQDGGALAGSGSQSAIKPTNNSNGSGTGGYNDWAGVYAYFFSILIYTTTYLTIVQNAFNLISILPDKVLRWIGGSPESIGSESARWGDEVKSKIGDAGKGTQDAQGQMGKQLGGYGQKGIAKAKDALGKATSKGDTSFEGGS